MAKRGKGKKGQFWGTLTPWLIGIAILVIVGIFVYLLRDKLAEYGKQIFSIMRGGK